MSSFHRTTSLASLTLRTRLLAIEVSYKYTQAEARVVFDVAGLRLVQQWTDSRQLHSLYLLEKTPFFFPSSAALLKTPSPIAANPYGVPSIAEWETMWKCWDAMTVSWSRFRGLGRH